MPQHSTPIHLSRLLQMKTDDPSTSLNGNASEIIGIFGSADQLPKAVNQIHSLLYAA